MLKLISFTVTLLPGLCWLLTLLVLVSDHVEGPRHCEGRFPTCSRDVAMGGVSFDLGALNYL